VEQETTVWPKPGEDASGAHIRVGALAVAFADDVLLAAPLVWSVSDSAEVIYPDPRRVLTESSL